MSGYSDDAVEALKAGKELNLILFDDSDVRLVAEDKLGIAEAIRLKLRAAAESGTPFLKLSNVLDVRSSTAAAASPVTFVFVEGRFDQQVFEYLRHRWNATLPVKFVTTAGPMNMAPTIDAIAQAAGTPISFVAILESDQMSRKVAREVEEMVAQINSEGGSAQMLWIPGTLEESLGLYEPDSRPPWRLRPDQLNKLLATVDLDEQVRRYPDLVPVLNAVGVPVSTASDGSSQRSTAPASKG